MNLSSLPAGEVGGIPVARLKEVLKAADDDQLATFLHGYAMGFAADQFIANMTRANERIGFLVSMAQTYPDDWTKAVAMLQAEGAQDSPTAP